MLDYELLIFCCRLWHKEDYKAKRQKDSLDSYPKELFHSMGSPQWKCHPLLHTSPHPWLPPLSVEVSDSTNHFCTTTTISNSPNKILTTKSGTYILFMHWLLVWWLVICWSTTTIAAVILVIVFILVAALFGSLLWLLIRRGSTLHCQSFP